MNQNIAEALLAQGLDESDIEINSKGQMSDKQIARQVQVRKMGGRGVWIIGLLGLSGCVGFGVWKFIKGGDIGIIIFMSILGLFLAAVPLGIYYIFRFKDPAKIALCKVIKIEHAAVGSFLPAPYRGIYTISLNGQVFSGFANGLSKAHLGTSADAYVVAEHKIVVALVPVN